MDSFLTTLKVTAMSNLENFSFKQVTQENADRLRHLVEKYGGSVSGETEGVVANDCFTLDYRYSPNDQVLEIRPQMLDSVVTPAALRRSIKKLLELPASAVHSDTTPTTKPTPKDQSCGVYLWVYGFISNNTSLPLAVLGSYDTANCISVSMKSPVAPGTTITSTSTPIFKWHGQKNTFNTGACKIQYTIGQDTLTVTFQMQDNSPPDGLGVTATMSGTRFTADNTTHSASFDSGAAASDLYIYIQVDNVT